MRIIVFLWAIVDASRNVTHPQFSLESSRPSVKDVLSQLMKSATDPDLLQIWKQAIDDSDGPLPEPPLSSFPFLVNSKNSIGNYVALGDSYASGRGVPKESKFCGRSDHNYPSLLAQSWKPDHFSDVTCSGAKSANIFILGQWSAEQYNPPQATAVKNLNEDNHNAVITISIGGNDENFYAWALGYCVLLRNSNGCAPKLGPIVGEKIEKVKAHVRTSLRALRLLRPNALIILVGYPRLTTRDRTCAQLPLAPTDLDWIVNLEETLDKILSETAFNAGVKYISLMGVSKGHEVCSNDPVRMAGNQPGDDAAPFHPPGGLIKIMAAEVNRRLELMKSEARLQY